ncbi:MAG: CDP-diacylglycerol--glycerol-3-phosphate 3-phosphatidyltransferase [Candidatus Omnitrophica bacterium]|nr:CDP-diacylglycerol--glycerol-3-phosphate 3-phosphatidyltransferase [Candidatus Omnitrophota bacterium]
MTLSNKLTISRIFLTFVFMFFLFSRGVPAKAAALVFFIAATVTDYLDGFFAKTRNEITNFGKIMDPIADKILTLAAFLAFVEMELVPAWIVVIIILRELVITGLRLAALAKGEVMAAGRGGKHKTVSQMISIFTILIFILFKEAGVDVFRFWNTSFEYWYRQIIFILMIVTVILTVISGASYIVRNKKYLFNSRY